MRRWKIPWYRSLGKFCRIRKTRSAYREKVPRKPGSLLSSSLEGQKFTVCLEPFFLSALALLSPHCHLPRRLSLSPLSSSSFITSRRNRGASGDEDARNSQRPLSIRSPVSLSVSPRAVVTHQRSIAGNRRSSPPSLSHSLSLSAHVRLARCNEIAGTEATLVDASRGCERAPLGRSSGLEVRLKHLARPFSRGFSFPGQT